MQILAGTILCNYGHLLIVLLAAAAWCSLDEWVLDCQRGRWPAWAGQWAVLFSAGWMISGRRF